MAGDYGQLNSLADTDNQVKQVMAIVETLDPKMHVTLNMISQGEEVDGISGQINWQEKNVHARAGTIDEALDNSETAIDVQTGEGNSLGQGDVLLIESEIVVVVSVSTDTITVRRGQHSSSAATHDDDTVWTKIGNANLEGITLVARGFLDITEYYNYVQEHAYTYQETFMSQGRNRYGGSTKLDDSLIDALIACRTDLNNMIYRGVRTQYDGTVARMMGGMQQFLTQGNSATDFSSDPVSEKIVNNMFEDIMATAGDKRRPTAILSTYPMKQAIAHIYRDLNAYNREAESNAAGMRIETIVTPYGDIELVADTHCQTGVIYLVDLSDMKVHPSPGMQWQTKDNPIAALANEKTVFGAYTMTIGNPKSMLYNAGLAESYA